MTKKKLTTEEFIKKARAIHGDKYNYSKTVYECSKRDVSIICPIHGEYKQRPNNHLNGSGCTICRTKRDEIVFGIGINDFKDQIHRRTIQYQCYTTWNSMIRRCYSKVFHQKVNTYQDCTVCDEWLLLSNFKEWFDENYIEGYALDKDILVKGNKVYSPDTCCFVPSEINALLTKRQNYRGDYPIGVTKNGNKFYSYLNKKDKRIKIGSFNDSINAFFAYKTAKEQYVKDLATSYFNNGKITKKVYESLMKYEVEITD